MSCVLRRGAAKALVSLLFASRGVVVQVLCQCLPELRRYRALRRARNAGSAWDWEASDAVDMRALESASWVPGQGRYRVPLNGTSEPSRPRPHTPPCRSDERPKVNERGTKGDSLNRNLLADMNENWAAWLQFTAEHAAEGDSVTFGTVRCSSVGVPIPLFNQAFVFDEPLVDDLASATSWLAERNVPFFVTAPDTVADAVAGMAEEAGLEATATTMPGMAFAPLDDVAAEDSDEVEIMSVTDSAQLTEFAAVASEAFGAPLEAAGTLAPASSLTDDRCSWFIGYLDGDLAACGQLLRTAHVAGVYSIGVRDRFRRRGLGAAITAAVLLEGRALGCTTGVLQASPMGQPVYGRMGFETVTQYHSFSAPG